MDLKGGISIDADSGPLGYILWCCGSESQDFFLLLFRLALAILWHLNLGQIILCFLRYLMGNHSQSAQNKSIFCSRCDHRSKIDRRCFLSTNVKKVTNQHFDEVYYIFKRKKDNWDYYLVFNNLISNKDNLCTKSESTLVAYSHRGHVKKSLLSMPIGGTNYFYKIWFFLTPYSPTFTFSTV